MKEIKRDRYLEKLINRRENGLIKIVTGIRRCGKSYLLDPIYKNYLIETGVKEDHIIKIDLDVDMREGREYPFPFLSEGPSWKIIFVRRKKIN